MNLNLSKILQGCILSILGASIWIGCQSQVQTKTTENNPSPTLQPGEPVDVEPVDTEASSSDETPTTLLDAPDTSISPTRILIADEITTLDPYQMISIHPAGSVARHLWDTLTIVNDNLQVKPHLAESWRLLNNLTWEINLRQGLSFHNGEPINAEAVHFSIERAQMPGSLETFDADINLDAVEIIDEYTLQIITRQPVANLPYHLAFLEILPPIYYSETGPKQLEANPIGSGPYQLSQWSPGKELVLDAVPTYWQGPALLPRLVFKTVPLAEERIAALRLEQAELVTDLPPIQKAEWNVADSSLEAIESTQRMFIGLKIEEGSPLADRGVRQALNYGINVQEIIDEHLAGFGERYSSWVNRPSNNPELTPWPYDPDLALSLLEEAGYSEGFTTTLHIPSDVYYQDMAIAKTIAQQLRDIGVLVEVESADWNIYANNLLFGEDQSLFMLGLNSHGNGLEDVRNLSTDFIFNPTGWQSDSFANILGQAMNTFNENSQARLLNEAQVIAYEEAPWIWLWRSYYFYGVSERLDWTPRRDGLVNLYKPTLADSNSD